MSTFSYANLCPGCFADNGGSAVCVNCGYDEKAPRSLLVLPHRTILNNQYLIGSVLGKLGGFGITYLAWDMHLETPVAIKEYLPRDLAGRDSNRLTVTAHSKDDSVLFLVGLELFLKEARTLAKFDHENIVRVRNVLEENGTAYLVMNFYEGTTLAAHLESRGGRLAETIALSIMLPVLDGLREVHGKGFLHRDIKPQNIYLTKSGTPILLDFGSARMLMGERTRSMTVLMTPGYAPFEQYLRKGQQGPWTDIYACGATLYHMLTGVVPMEATERAEIDALQPPDSLVPGISPAVSSVVMRAMAMNREARPPNVAEFMDALVHANSSEPPPAVINKPEGGGGEPDAEGTQHEFEEIILSPYFKAALGKSRQAYYLRIFTRYNSNWVELMKPSWNWAGFLLNAFWLLYKRIFLLGVIFFVMPLLAMLLANSKIIGLLCWLMLSIVIGCYGNALYYNTLSRRIYDIEQQFPGSRLHPLKLSRLESSSKASILIPFIYFIIGLIAVYSQGQYPISSPENKASGVAIRSKPLFNKPSEQETQYAGEDLLNDNVAASSPYEANRYKEKADELVKNSDWAALLVHSQKWCALDRINPDAWLDFGLANYQLAQYSLAQPAFETYFRLKPEDNDYVLGLLVKTYIKLKKTGAAERALLKVIALRSILNRPKSSEDAFYYNELGNIYFLSNEKKQEAVQLYGQALETDPGNVVFKSNVELAAKALMQENASAILPNEVLNGHTAGPNIDNVSDTKQKVYNSLSAAAAAGDIEAVKLLLSKGADVNKMEMGGYPLIQASKHRQSEMVDYLLKNGANLNMEDSHGNKAINYSIVNGDKKTMDLLTNAGAFHLRR